MGTSKSTWKCCLFRLTSDWLLIQARILYLTKLLWLLYDISHNRQRSKSLYLVIRPKTIVLQILSEKQNKKTWCFVVEKFRWSYCRFCTKDAGVYKVLRLHCKPSYHFANKQHGNKLARTVSVIKCYSLTLVTFNLCPCTKDVTGSCQLCAIYDYVKT